MKTKLFLDLEDTVINKWDEGLLVNTKTVRDWIVTRNKLRPIDEICVFSFAIWDQMDKDFFERNIKQMLEQALEIKEITEWLSVEEMQQIIEKWSGFKFEDRTDFMQMHGKHDAFAKVCFARETNSKCILLDDAVPSRTILDHSRGLTVELVPVQNVTGRKVDNEHAVERL